MQRLILCGLLLTVITLAGLERPNATSARGSFAQKPRALQLTLSSSQKIYRPNDQFKIQVMLMNAGEEPLYVYGVLGWGYSASLVFHVLDSSGREVEPTLIPDSPPHAPPDDKSEFVKLQPDNFLGTSYFAPLKMMNLTKPGNYSVFVEYWCPFSSSDVAVSPFWGKEQGKLRSNIVRVRVIK